MAEILNLWNENLSENAALFIPLHPLQVQKKKILTNLKKKKKKVNGITK